MMNQLKRRSNKEKQPLNIKRIYKYSGLLKCIPITKLRIRNKNITSIKACKQTITTTNTTITTIVSTSISIKAISTLVN